MSKKKKDEITLSPKYGVNPSITHCECCGKEIGIALLGKLKGDIEAPREIAYGLCDDCQSVIDNGGIIILEVESESNPSRTGRMVGCSKEFKEKIKTEHSIVYMDAEGFSKLFNEQFTKDDTTGSN